MEPVLGLVIFALALGIYFLPTICAFNKKGSGGVFVLNLFLGWTLVGWVVALAWAVSAPKLPTANPQSRLVVTTPPGSEVPHYAREGERLLVTQVQTEPVVWKFESEGGAIAEISGEDAKKMSFRAQTIGSPHAAIWQILKNGSMQIVVDFRRI